MCHTSHDKKVALVKAELERVDKELEALQQQRAELLTFLRVDERYERLAGADLPVADAGKTPAVDAFVGIDVDFTGTSNLLERILRVAAATTEPLDAMSVAEYLVARGQSKSSTKNLRAHILNILKGDPDFEKIGVGRFRYIPDNATDFPGVTLTTGTSADTMLQ